ncbi:hypothetical protein [Pendulispora albinea]|uniref:Uncharacterized protein n=1 Tax=Pendulispora albinea TaxID=2741071 RepID=A0ABZ2LUQ3_9BACT
MDTITQTVDPRRLAAYAAASSICADRYAKAFYPMTKDADEKMICCVHGGEQMAHYIAATETLRGLGVDLGNLTERPLTERGLDGVGTLATTANWTERAVFSALFERAVTFVLRELATSGHPATAAMANFATPRVERHAAHGLRLLRAMCASEDGRAEAQAAVRRAWSAALALLGTGRSRGGFVQAVRDELSGLGLVAPE